MALGLVQSRTDLITATPRQLESSSPRHLRRQRLTSFSNPKNPINADIRYIMCNLFLNICNIQPYIFRLDIVLDTPVLVLPRSSCSPHVFVAHLGKISVTNIRAVSAVNTPPIDTTVPGHIHSIFTIDEENPNMFSMEELNISTADVFLNDDTLLAAEELETYTIDVRNMNLFSLDTTTRKGFRL